MDQTCTCLIPFYNEGKGIVQVLNKITTVDQFDQIILINDGSNDKSEQLVRDFIDQQSVEHATVVSHETNRGKAQAVFSGLKLVTTEYVFLFDADLQGINPNEIASVVERMYRHPEIDMSIMRRVYAKWYIKLFYRELLMSGQRMLRTKALRKVAQKDVERYQLEVAINDHFHKHDKTVVWAPFSADNPFKCEKRGFRDGRKRDISMFREIIGYLGAVGFIEQIFLFQSQRVDNYQPCNSQDTNDL